MTKKSVPLITEDETLDNNDVIKIAEDITQKIKNGEITQWIIIGIDNKAKLVRFSFGANSHALLDNAEAFIDKLRRHLVRIDP